MQIEKKKKILDKALIIIAIITIIMGLSVIGAMVINKTEIQFLSQKGNEINKLYTSTESNSWGVYKERDEISQYEGFENKTKTKEYSQLYTQYLNLSREEREQLAVIPRKYDIPMDVLYEDNKTQKKSLFSRFLGLFQSSQTEEIPESYILLQNEDTGAECEQYGGIDIKVEDQGPYGLCWDFVSLTALETHLALKGFNYDFSERHLDYLTSEEFGGERTLESGGSFYFFNQYCINNYGPVLEQDVPYDKKYSTEEYDYLLELNPVIYVDGTIEFPTIYKNETITYTEEELGLFRNKVKKHIMQNGALFATICSSEDGTDGWFSGKEIIKKYNGKYVLNYNGSHLPNHAITIIGWDDTFSRENFPEECRPSSNGAYIALNSWGDSWGDNGVFYISYEDIYVETYMCGITSATTEENIYEIVNFEDENLYNAMKDTFGRKIMQYDDENRKLHIDKNLIQNVTNLDISNKGIENLAGIEVFTNLITLDLGNNSISNITSLQNLAKLQKLDLKNNNISDISNLQNLTSLEVLDLSGNNISDISSLPNERYTKLVLSSNPIEIFTTHAIEIDEVYFDNCNLENDDILKIYETIPNYLLLSLRNNNITDLSCIKYEYYERKTIDLSGNYDINLDTIPTVGELILSNCNISNVDKISEKFLGDNLNLSYNPINDISQLQCINLYKLDISYTDIVDISCLSNIKYLNVSGNKNLNGLNELTNLTSLEINDCNLNDTTLNNNIGKLSNLELLSINNNSITNIDFVNNYQFLQTLYANNNKINNINTIYNGNIKNLYLSNNNISDISGLNNFTYFSNLNLSNNNISDLSCLSNIVEISRLDLSNNTITDISPIESIRFEYDVILSNNKIEDIENKFVIAKNQELLLELDIEKDKLNTINLPSLINTAFKNGMYEENIQFFCENCTINKIGTKMNLVSNTLGEGQAKITIKGGRFDGTTYTINYNTVEKINVTNIKVKSEAAKKYYIENENFDTNGLVVEVTYENGLIENTTDYTLINNENLIAGQEGVIIRSNKTPEIETIHPIVVYAEDEILEIQFVDNNLYNAIKDKSAFGDWARVINIIKYDDQQKTITMSRETIAKVSLLELRMKNITNISGIENFINIEFIDLSHNSNLESINELLLLNNIKNINIIETEVENVKDFINKDSVKQINIRKNNQNTINDTATEIELPDFIYQSLTMQEGVTVEAYIYYDVINNDNFLQVNGNGNQKNAKVKINDEKQKAIIEIDRQITNENKEGIRGIEVYINGGKTNGAMYVGFYNVNRELQEIAITTPPTRLNYCEGEDFDKTGMVVTATFNDESCKVISDYTVLDGDNLNANQTSVTISYAEDGITKTTTQSITVTAKLEIDLGTYEEKQKENNTYITNIAPETTIGKFIENIDTNGTIEIYKGADKISDTEVNIGTGMIVKITLNKEQKEYAIVVKGDINGDGKVKLSDFSKLKLSVIGTTQLEGAYKEAADLNGDGNVKLSDFSKMKLYLVGKATL